MDVDNNQSVKNVMGTQLNQGLFQVQTDLDNLKTQMQAEKLNRNIEHNESVKRKIKLNVVLTDLSDQIVFLSKEIMALKTYSISEMDGVIKAIKTEFAACVGEMKNNVKSFESSLNNVKKSIADQVGADFSTIIAKEFYGEEGRLTKLAEDVADGVEQKLDLKFGEMFLELNRFLEANKSTGNNEKMDEIVREQKILIAESKKDDMLQKEIVSSIEALSSRMENFEKLLSNNAQSMISNNRESQEIANKPLIEKFDKLAEKVAENVENTIKVTESKIDANNHEIDEMKINVNNILSLVKAKEEVDLKPIFEVINALDNKIADIKVGVDETKKKVAGINIDEKGNIKNDSSELIMKEIPRIVKESVANSFKNVDDSDNKIAYEKLVNQMNMMFANDEERFAEIMNQIGEIRSEIASTDGSLGIEGFKQIEMEETLASLRGELTNLSKLIEDAEDNDSVEVVDSEVPNAIKEATSALDGLTKEIFDN